MMAQSGFAGGAALTCSNYSVTVDGVTYDDWYLPSIDELKLMYKTNNKNRFCYTYYWSSLEYSSSKSWFYRYSGYTDKYDKGTQLFVRAARSF